MRHTILATLALFLCASASSQVIWDRTNEPKPLVVTQDTDWSGIVLIDENLDRPAIIVTSGTLKLGAGYRPKTDNYDDPTDPGLGATFDGVFLPTLKITFSHHDFARAFIVCMGEAGVYAGAVSAPVGCLVLPSPEGAYGHNQNVTIGEVTGRFGVMASGQENLNVNIRKSTQDLYNTGAPGHTLYGNECRNAVTGEYLRLRSPLVRVGSVLGVRVGNAGINLDNVSAKFKGSWGVDYECLDDQNPCGAFDDFGSSGVAKIKWTHPGSSDQNQYFTAFRLGGAGTFGNPDGKMILMGSFDARKAPDQTLKIGQVETPMSGFSVASFAGVQGPMVYPGADVRGLGRVMEIPK